MIFLFCVYYKVELKLNAKNVFNRRITIFYIFVILNLNLDFSLLRRGNPGLISLFISFNDKKIAENPKRRITASFKC